jgi:cytosine/adenosine deaminase-related metal-dependent hydrolase
MTYRKFKADYLFMGGAGGGAGNESIRETGLLEEGKVLITSEEGIVQDVVAAAAAGEDVEYYPGLLSPGFVNCHCHLELSHMRGMLPEGAGLVDFLTAVMRRRGEAAEGAGGDGAVEGGGAGGGGGVRGGSAGAAGAVGGVRLSREQAMADGEQEMWDNGIVAVGDICNTPDTVPLKTGGRLYYHNFIETVGFIEQTAGDRFAQSLSVFKAFAELYALPIAANSIVPHAPYSVSSALFKLTAGFPGNHILTIHNQESEEENMFYLSGKGDFLRLYAQMGLDVSFFQGTGKRSLASYLPYFYRNQSLILVHNVATREEDLRAAGFGGGGLRSAGGVEAAGGATLYFCLCPNANLYISGLLPDVDMLVRNGCTIVLGTDSLASNHQLSILEEMKTLQKAFPQLGTAQLLQWATGNGARALQLDGVLGSFRPGKQPGVVLIGGLDGQRLGDRATARRLL